MVLLRIAVAALLWGLMPALAHADKRVALVIGNGEYAKVGKLPNPPRDAATIAALFRTAGFEVVEVKTDLGVAAMRRALRDFSDQVREADIAVVFFAGHGIEVNGTNYLIPVDAGLERDIDVEDEAVPLDRVTQMLEQAKRLRLVILDACRDNPFVRSMKRTVSTRSVGRGLAKVEVLGSDTLVAFAARAGSTAADGEGGNSPYTAALIKHLTTPGLDLRLSLGRVRDEVLKSTGNRQEPFVYGSLGGAEIALVPAPKVEAKPPPPQAPPVSQAAFEWSRVDKASVAELETFVRRHASSAEAEYAQARIEQLTKQQAAAAAAAKQPPPAAAPLAATSALAPAAAAGQKTALAVPVPKPGIQKPQACEGNGVEFQIGNDKRCLKPKQAFKDCPGCPEMVLVPSGRFMMGSPASEEGRFNSEGPQHSVTIADPFAVGKFALTRAEFEAFVKAAKHPMSESCYTMNGTELKEAKGKSFRDPGFAQADNHPAVCVSWDDAKAYVAWLSKTTAKDYRLLTEAEREYVARAGTTTPYPWGASVAAEQANYDARNTTGGGGGEWRKKTLAVDSFRPNAFGLHQMHGNVFEWTEDCWNATYQGAPADGSAWVTGECGRRVLKGGSWFGPAKFVRSAGRVWNYTGVRSSLNGVRVARSLSTVDRR
jgi:formylglycine-generating enzyme required for sulfatase activity